jgi:hypothetical protein
VRALERWLGNLGKILHDEFLFEVAGDGRAQQATRREHHAKGAFALGSTVDPEATFRKHGKRNELGYNVQVAATPNFIREIYAVTGATPDGSGVAALIAHQREHLGVVPPKLLYDAAAGYPKYFAEVERASGGQTQLVSPLVKNGRQPSRFGPRDFTLGENGELICPGGQVSTKMYRKGHSAGWDYRFTPDQCRGCPLLAQCHKDPHEPIKTRTVSISDYASHQREALAYTRTLEFKEEFKGRAHIERIIAILTRYNDGRTARGYGLRSADFQARLAAMAYNLKRWHKMTLDQEKAAHRPARQKREAVHDPPQG